MINPRYITNIIDPDRLLLSWQPPKDSKYPRMRRFVAELIPNSNDADLVYMFGTEDFAKAKEAGFIEYPGFTIDKQLHSNVLAAFMRRLPPRNRNDFGRFLTALRINPAEKNNIADFSLLGYSGAKLPGDGFSVVNPFNNATPPFEFLAEIQGYRHYLNTVPYENLSIALSVTLKPEPDNKYDDNAIMVITEGKQIGHICRGQNVSFHKWLSKGYNIDASIERINGTQDNPKIYALIKVTATN